MLFLGSRRWQFLPVFAAIFFSFQKMSCVSEETTNRLYTQDLATGDMFMLPKGMVHYQFNQGNSTATARSAFRSATPGLVSVPLAVFNTGIDKAVLAKSFKTDEATIQKLRQAWLPVLLTNRLMPAYHAVF